MASTFFSELGEASSLIIFFLAILSHRKVSVVEKPG